MECWGDRQGTDKDAREKDEAEKYKTKTNGYTGDKKSKHQEGQR